MFKKLTKWSEQFSDLPWRQNRTLYSTLVSEIMLQQTTVGTVLNHYQRFLKEYPSIYDLAAASEEELTISWKGLGYYRRARNLKKACEFIVNKYEGEIPLDYEILISIPGIGPYTASALISIGADKPALAIDANLERVLSRFYGIKIEKGPKLHQEIMQRFKDKKILRNIKSLGPRAVNEALMDLGRQYCKARSAACDICPLAKSCVALETDPLAFPVVKDKKPKKMYELELYRFIVKDKKKLLAYQKSDSEWLHGQWEVPTFIMYSEDKSLKQYPVFKKKLKIHRTVKTGITKYKIKNHIIELELSEFRKISKLKKYQFVELSTKSNLASSTDKFIKKSREKV
jgi:A/G-specific adenine glycosylase